MVIDKLDAAHPLASNGARWQLFTDQVMGGISQGSAVRETVAGRAAIRLRGDVRLDNNGGFVQVGLDLTPDASLLDASGYDGVEIDVRGNAQQYGVHLRTDAVTRPWQSYRQSFVATESWQTLRLPFAAFEAHRLDRPLDTGRLRRVGIAAIGRAFAADIALARLAFYRLA
jgi:hypothetical protein